MTLSAAQIKAEIETGPLAAQLASAWAAGETSVVCEALNAKTSTLQAPAPIAETELMGLVTQSEFDAIFDHPRFSEFKEDISSQDPLKVSKWIIAFGKRGLLSGYDPDPTQCAGSVAAGLVYLSRTVPTPASRVEVLANQLGAAWSLSQIDAARAL